MRASTLPTRACRGVVHRSFVYHPNPVPHLRGAVRDGHETWTHWDLNPGPPPCKGGALPLSYGPGEMLALVVRRCPNGRVANRLEVGRGNAPIPIVRR